MKRRIPDIGGHVSTAGGISLAIKNGEAISASTIQIFGSSPQTWSVKLPSENEVKKFKDAHAKSRIGPVYLHAAYLVNLASASDEIYEKSIANLSGHLKIADMIGADGLIFHLGSNKGISKEEGMEKEIKGMKEVLARVKGKTLLIMENSAGGGDKIGSDIADIKYLFKGVNSDRVKICFDTAHAFEAGIMKEYSEDEIKVFFDTWDREIGLEHIVVFHMNDSKTVYGSHHDRHENIGEGHIGINGFNALAKEKRILDKTWLLEVPGFEGEGPDKKNIEILHSLFR